MALDTRDRRASAVHVGLPWRGLLPLPDAAAEDQGDRQHVGGYYRGVLAALPGFGSIPLLTFGPLSLVAAGGSLVVVEAARGVGVTLMHADGAQATAVLAGGTAVVGLAAGGSLATEER